VKGQYNFQGDYNMNEREKLYGQHVCLNARIAVSPSGQMKEVGLAYQGKTLCNNAWIDVVSANKQTPTCNTECPECKSHNRIHRQVFSKALAKRSLSKEQLEKMQAGKKAKTNSVLHRIDATVLKVPVRYVCIGKLIFEA